MKIKKNIHHVLFFDIFFSFILIFLISLGFFFGFEISKETLTNYFLIIIGVILICTLILFAYILLCNTYFEFTENAILLVKRTRVLKEIRYEQIVKADYYKIYNLLLGNPQGGCLTIYYNENGRLETMELSISFRKVTKIPVRGLIIKTSKFN